MPRQHGAEAHRVWPHGVWPRHGAGEVRDGGTLRGVGAGVQKRAWFAGLGAARSGWVVCGGVARCGVAAPGWGGGGAGMEAGSCSVGCGRWSAAGGCGAGQVGEKGLVRAGAAGPWGRASGLSFGGFRVILHDLRTISGWETSKRVWRDRRGLAVGRSAGPGRRWGRRNGRCGPVRWPSAVCGSPAAGREPASPASPGGVEECSGVSRV